MRNLCLFLSVGFISFCAVAHTSESPDHWYVTSSLSSTLIRIDKRTGERESLEVARTNQPMSLCGDVGYVLSNSDSWLFFIDLSTFRIISQTSYLHCQINKTFVYDNRYYVLINDGRIQGFSRDQSVFLYSELRADTQWFTPRLYNNKGYFVGLVGGNRSYRLLTMVIFDFQTNIIIYETIDNRYGYTVKDFEIVDGKGYINCDCETLVIDLRTLAILTQFYHYKSQFLIHPSNHRGYLPDVNKDCIRCLCLNTFQEIDCVKLSNLHSFKRIIFADTYLIALSENVTSLVDRLNLINLEDFHDIKYFNLLGSVQQIYVHEGIVYICYERSSGRIAFNGITTFNLQSMGAKKICKPKDAECDLYFQGRWMCVLYNDFAYLYDLKRQYKLKKNIGRDLRSDVSITGEGIYSKGKNLFHLKKKFDVLGALFVTPEVKSIVNELWEDGTSPLDGQEIENRLNKRKSKEALKILFKGLRENDPTARAFMYACLAYPYYGNAALTLHLGPIRQALALCFKVGADPESITYYDRLLNNVENGQEMPWIDLYF